ncbi:hypothetical protein ALC57_07053 [Trachymyrmex cornetzi]|uniref:Uncharacterized protein n=1 Tax=Trachymyrmex cornetzi TaxID=471704 RepID=A0A195E6U1_9HYME|nr:hypothetical protein ALC57_07053 [Trachymyrmex cornetzi]
MGKGFANVDPLSSWRFSECAEYAKLTDDTCTDVGVEGEARWCRITAGIVKSRHGEEEEKAAAGKPEPEEEEEEEEVIRNTVREYNTTSTPE